MRWWDFSDLSFVTMFIIVLVAFVTIVFFIVTFAVSNNVNRTYRKKIKAQSNTARIYVLNTKKNIVTYFNRTNLKKRGTMDFNMFFNHFHENDSEKVKDWIKNICSDDPNVPTYIEADICLPKYNRQYFSLLKLINYDKENGIINVESFILKYISPKNISVKRKKGMIQGVVKRSTISEIISNNKNTDGYTFAIRFFHLHQGALVDNVIETFILMSLKNQVYPFLNNGHYPRQIVEEENNELILLDLKLATKDGAISLAESIAKNLKKWISIQSYQESVSFAIGIAENRLFYQNFDAMVEQAKKACILAEQKKIDYYFGKPGNYSKLDINGFNKEINRLLEGNDIRYLFRPIIDTTESKAIGYISYIKTYGLPFSSSYEMSKYASQAGRGKELFAMLYSHIIPRFVSQTREYNDLKLFIPVSLYDISYIHTLLPEISFAKETDIVLMFREQEIKENALDVEKLNNILESCKDDGYSIALFLTDKNILLDSSIYKEFDYFLCGSSMIGEIRKSNHVRLSIHTLIEQLLKYKKPIIATDLEGWQAVELIIKSGISYISSETISHSNDMILPLDKKKLDKIALMAKKYL